MLNRWNRDVCKGMKVSAVHPRGDARISGIIEKIEHEPFRGYVATLDSGYSISIDDVITELALTEGL